jgi:prephenate dehydratase
VASRKVIPVPAGTRVAFQGEPGAFSQTACNQLFGPRIEVVPCPSFDSVFEAVRRRVVPYAVVPIENSLAGSVHQNYDLMERHAIEVLGETFVRIEHSLIALPGATLRSVRKVYSHPVALAQCLRFFKRFPRMEPVQFYDTAGSVKHIRETELEGAAAIASAESATIYGMKVLRRGIEDDAGNFTRFLALAPRGKVRHRGGKTSIVFALRNEPGALFKALSVFALREVDLSKIESRPILGKPWEYLFYADLRADTRSAACDNALRHLREFVPYFRLLGSYRTY